MKQLLFAIALQVSGMAAIKAQQINGLVKDEQENAISNATVSLLKAKDSSVVKLQLSKAGNFTFSPATHDTLLISISYVGHQTIYSEKFFFNGEQLTLPAFTLQSANTRLQAVTVNARKKIIDVKPDKTVLNVEGTINATGSDALDVLRKAPGVTVDNDEKLSVNGKNGVQVYIDNKPTPLNGQDLSSYLKSIPSAQIEAIEAAKTSGLMISSRRRKNSASVKFTRFSASNFWRKFCSSALRFRISERKVYFRSVNLLIKPYSISGSLTDEVIIKVSIVKCYKV